MKDTNLIDDPERRKLLTWMASCLAHLPALAIMRPNKAAAIGGPRQRLKASLSVILGDRQAAEEIGRLYLADHPEEDDPDLLAAILLGSDEQEDTQSLHQRIRDLRMRDFGNDDLVIVRGWVLARVEARVCALICIL